MAGSDEDTRGTFLNNPEQRGPMHRSPHIVFDPAEVIETRREARLATTLDLVFERHPAYRSAHASQSGLELLDARAQRE